MKQLTMRHRRAMQPKRSSSAGFTVIEVLIVVGIAGLLFLLLMQVFTRYIPRYQLRGTAAQVAQLISRARLEAIKRGVTTVMAADFTERTLTLFADVNGDPADPFAAGKLYLVLDPDPGMQVDRTDYLINTFPLPGTIQFAGPQFGVGGADAVTGFTAVPGAPAGTPPVLVFSRTGAIENPGAFRFGDDGDKNHLEAAVVNLIGKVEVRKYLLAADSPTLTDDFFAEGNEVFDGTKMGKTVWVWYD